MSAIRKQLCLVLIMGAIVLLSLDRLGNSFNPPRSQQSLRWKGVTDTAIPKSEVECKDAESDSAALTGEKIRAYDGPRRFRNATVDLGDDLYTPLSQFDFGRAVPVCSQWTIVEPSADDNASHLLDLVTLDDWCLLLVGEHAVSSQAHGNRVVVLSFDQLHKDYQRLPEDIGWKNTGHLFAIEHGAELILDTPPDFQFETLYYANVPRLPFSTRHVSKSRPVFAIRTQHNQSSVLNPFKILQPPRDGWPRGFPIKRVSRSAIDTEPIFFAEVPSYTIGVAALVHTSDVDAVGRLQNGAIESFQRSPHDRPFLVSSYAPFGSGFWTTGALWSLLLPPSKGKRTSDVWRSYLAQRMLKEIGLSTILLTESSSTRVNSSAPPFLQEIAADAEVLSRAEQFLSALEDWRPDSPEVPSMMEDLWIHMYERGFLDKTDVEAVQAWMEALIRLACRFPERAYPPSVVTQSPSRHGQPYHAHPQYNLNPDHLTYEQYVGKTKAQHFHNSAWQHWLASVDNSTRPTGAVVKLLLMTKDEWPLIRHWTLYHGELLGFEHLYIIDGSSDERCISFLLDVRDRLGVNVIFSDSNLNELEAELTEIGKTLSGSADFLIKVDTDEFLGSVVDENCCTTGANCTLAPCELSPVAAKEYLKDASNLLSVADGRRLKIGFEQKSRVAKELCDAGRGDDIGSFPFFPAIRTPFKVVFDARTFCRIDLGGHVGEFLAPHTTKEERYVPLGIIHTHNRCLEHEVSNCRKAITSHGYIGNDDTDEEALAKLLHYTGPEPCILNGVEDMKKGGASIHKVLFYSKYLACREQVEASFYATPGGTVSEPFRVFLQAALDKNAP